ncbi:MAG TPA: hypothetical protein V6D02_11240 [Candidatus Obscuribacterales bacterium]
MAWGDRPSTAANTVPTGGNETEADDGGAGVGHAPGGQRFLTPSANSKGVTYYRDCDISADKIHIP